MNVFFVIDEYTDLANGIETRYLADIVMDALWNPHKERPSGEWIGGQIVQESVNLAEEPPVLITSTTDDTILLAHT
jgi:Delta6-protoilludene synthase